MISTCDEREKNIISARHLARACGGEVKSGLWKTEEVFSIVLLGAFLLKIF